MRRILYITLITCFLSSCIKKVQLKASNDLTCTFKFPKEARVAKITSDDPTWDWLVKLPENKNIFISNNDKDGSPLNYYKYEELGENIVMKFLTNDMLILTGKNSFGNWKEIKSNGIVYGYMNIPDSEVSYFEMLITPKCK